jgi:hypothetical protein
LKRNAKAESQCVVSAADPQANVTQLIVSPDTTFQIREWTVRIMARNLRDGYTYAFDEYRIPEDDSRPVTDDLRRRVKDVCMAAAKEIERLLVNR